MGEVNKATPDSLMPDLDESMCDSCMYACMFCEPAKHAYQHRTHVELIVFFIV